MVRHMVRNAATMPSSRTPLIRGNGYRWRQALLALVIMLLISPYEYTFAIFEQPIATAHHWSLPSVATTYTIYIVVASLFMIPGGRWSDRWQPRWFTTVAGLVTGLGWITAAFAQTRPELYLAYGLGALGTGYIYCNCINNALKWFPESARRGMAVGLIDMGFGLGSAIFIPILTPVVDAGTYGYRTAFVAMGVVMLVIIVTVAQFLRYPAPGWLPDGYDAADERARIVRHTRGVANASRDFTWQEMLRTWQYWWSVIGLCFIAAAGLMITAHIVVVAKSDILVDAAAIGTAAATFSRIPNGVMRWVAGGLSDYLGRERLMVVFFCIMGIATILLPEVSVGWLFIVLNLVALGCWGPLFSLYPALVSDYWGRRYSGINYGLVYGPGRAIAGVWAGTVAATLFTISGSWSLPFDIAGALAIISGLMALVLRRPGRKEITRMASPRTGTALDESKSSLWRRSGSSSVDT
jgi:MFS transporter, OFA family, oxalate/formate antiporter